MIDTYTQVVKSILPILLWFTALYLASRRTKKPSITLFRQSSSDLFTKRENNLEGLEIKYNGTIVNGNIVLFDAIFLNDGNTDINKSKIFEPIEFELPENFSWLEYSISGSSPGLKVDPIYENGKLKFKWDIFKEGEYFSFKSLILYSPKINDNIIFPSAAVFIYSKINHRIEDLKDIQKKWNIPYLKSLFDLGLNIIGHLSLIIIGSVLSWVQFYSRNLSEFKLGNYFSFLLGAIMIIAYSYVFYEYIEEYRKNKFYKNIQKI